LTLTLIAALAGVRMVEFSYLLPRIIGDDLLLLKRRFSIDLLLLIRGLPPIVTSSFGVDCNVKVNGSIDLNTPLSVDDETTEELSEGEKAFVVINAEATAIITDNILDDAIANTDIHISS